MRPRMSYTRSCWTSSTSSSIIYKTHRRESKSSWASYSETTPSSSSLITNFRRTTSRKPTPGLLSKFTTNSEFASLKSWKEPSLQFDNGPMLDYWYSKKVWSFTRAHFDQFRIAYPQLTYALDPICALHGRQHGKGLQEVFVFLVKGLAHHIGEVVSHYTQADQVIGRDHLDKTNWFISLFAAGLLARIKMPEDSQHIKAALQEEEVYYRDFSKNKAFLGVWGDVSAELLEILGVNH